MKKPRLLARLALMLVVLCLLTSMAVLPTLAEETASRVYDPAELLASDEEVGLATRLEALSAQYGVELYLATYHGTGYYDRFVGDNYCATVRNLRNTDAVLLVVTYDGSDSTYYYDMYTYGRANRVITQVEVDYILDTDDVYYNIKRARLVSGIESFFDLSAQAYDGRVGVSYAIIIPVCAGISIVIGLIVAWGVISSYSKRNPSVDYPLDRFAALNLTAESDAFMTKHVTRTYVPRNSGSRGGGGRGGGGGHRGGR